MRVASVMGGRMGSNLFTGGGGKGAGCVRILLIILEAAEIFKNMQQEDILSDLRELINVRIYLDTACDD